MDVLPIVDTCFVGIVSLAGRGKRFAVPCRI
jgi:hypothetical protein